MRVWLDPVLMAAHSVTASDVIAAINGSNFLAAPGRTQNDLVSYRIEMQTTLADPVTFGALPITSKGDQVVHLRDVARVELAPASTDVKVTFNGSQGTFIGVFPTPAANPLDRVAAGPGGAAEDPGVDAGRHADLHALRLDQVHQRVDRRGVQDDRRGGRSSSSW